MYVSEWWAMNDVVHRKKTFVEVFTTYTVSFEKISKFFFLYDLKIPKFNLIDFGDMATTLLITVSLTHLMTLFPSINAWLPSQMIRGETVHRLDQMWFSLAFVWHQKPFLKTNCGHEIFSYQSSLCKYEQIFLLLFLANNKKWSYRPPQMTLEALKECWKVALMGIAQLVMGRGILKTGKNVTKAKVAYSSMEGEGIFSTNGIRFNTI